MTSSKEIDALTNKIVELSKELENQNNLQLQNSKLKALIEINTYITNTLEKDEILKIILDQTKDILNCDKSSILLVNKDLHVLKFGYLSKDEESTMLKDTALKMGEGIAGTVWQNGVPIVINNAQNDPRFSNQADKKSQNITESLLAAPLIVNGDIIGVIEAINKREQKNFSDFDLLMLQYISIQSAIAIKNAELYELAIRDGMTKLFIHKHFRERLSEEWSRAHRYKEELSLIMLDIDHFKNFNDNYGHQLGDSVLKDVANLIKENSRNIDIPCRYGGEEFAVVLPSTNHENALMIAERMRQSIANHSVEAGDKSIEVTVSLGVSTVPHESIKSADDFIEMTDKSLYLSKKNGRNQSTSMNQIISKL
jgi:two-component system cell cycle response regulator